MPMPASIARLLSADTAMAVAKTAAPVIAGAAAAQLGGQLLKQIDQVNDFVTGNNLNEALVDLAGGIIATGAVAGVMHLAGADEDTIIKTAALVGVGAVVGATAPLLATPIADGVDWVVKLIAGDDAVTMRLPEAKTSPPTVLATTQAPARRQLSGAPRVKPPGGLYDLHPGGLYDLAAM